MPTYDVTFTQVLRLTGRFTLQARTDTAAEDRAATLVEQLMGATGIAWEVTVIPGSPRRPTVEWEEEEDSAEDIEVSEA
jgi:hypothetical protein